MARTTIRSEDITAGQISAADMADDSVGVAELSATGTASTDTFLRGDNSWAEVAGGSSWQAVKTANFTAVAGEGYPVNSTSGEITITLPASASVGDTIEFVDYAGTFDTNNILLNPNGLKIKGQAGNLRLKTERLGAKIVYIDVTQGWLAVTSRTDRTLDPEFSGTGGTKTTSGGYDIHTFTSSGNFVVVGSGNVEILCIGGAGGGGAQHGGGGGAGGYRSISGVALTQQTYAIVVGAGGAGGSGAGANGVAGTNSSGLTYTSAGGGYGGSYPAKVGGAGGSGGGGGTDNAAGGAGNTPSTTPSQGNNGGTATAHSPSGGGGGGGGSAAVGGNASSTVGGVGGAGTQNNIDGNNYYWAGGAGGAGHVSGTTGGAGGIGGGGGGGNNAGNAGAGDIGNALNDGSPGIATGNGGNGGANTGGAGGGSGTSPSSGGNGGSGIVIIRYAS